MAIIEALIEPRLRDLGDGFHVRRVLPHAQRRMVGPFVFLDHFGPVRLPPGQGLDVRPHPHIALATVTYLFDGTFRHRDSLGSDQLLLPGAVNWMTAGRGIVHSERSPAEVRAPGPSFHGLQMWVALPREREEMAPTFQHHDAATIPELTRDGVRLRVAAGAAFGVESPVETQSPLFCVDAAIPAGGRLTLAPEDTRAARRRHDGHRARRTGRRGQRHVR